MQTGLPLACATLVHVHVVVFPLSTPPPPRSLQVGIDTGVPGSVLSALHGVEAGVGEGDRWVVGGYVQVSAGGGSGMLMCLLCGPQSAVRVFTTAYRQQGKYVLAVAVPVVLSHC